MVDATLMLMLVMMSRFFLPLLRIDLRQQPDMLMLVMASVSVLLMLVMMSRFFFPLLWIDSRQQVPMENLSKLVKGQGRVHQKANRGEPTYLFTKEAGWSPCKQKCSAKSSFLLFASL